MSKESQPWKAASSAARPACVIQLRSAKQAEELQRALLEESQIVCRAWHVRRFNLRASAGRSGRHHVPNAGDCRAWRFAGDETLPAFCCKAGPRPSGIAVTFSWRWKWPFSVIGVIEPVRSVCASQSAKRATVTPPKVTPSPPGLRTSTVEKRSRAWKDAVGPRSDAGSTPTATTRYRPAGLSSCQSGLAADLWERRRAGEPISTVWVESAINEIIAKYMAKESADEMDRWTDRPERYPD
jgi:hypothetical protein